MNTYKYVIAYIITIALFYSLPSRSHESPSHSDRSPHHHETEPSTEGKKQDQHLSHENSNKNSPDEFGKKIEDIMGVMHTAMSQALLSGNKDIDFMILMIPHHQSAIDMANLILETTQDKEVIKLAQDIITEQRNEISFMQRLIREKINVN